MRIRRMIALLLLAFLYTGSCFSNENRSRPEIRFTVYEDAGAKLSINEIRQLHSQNQFSGLLENRVSAKHSTSALWLHFTLPATKKSQPRYLVIGPGYLDTAILYENGAKENTEQHRQVAGDSVRFRDKPVNHPLHVFPLSQKAKSYFLQVSSEGILRVNWEVQDQQTFTAANLERNTWYALLLGILASMILYNLCLFSSIRDTTYLFYVSYHMSALVLIYAMAGYASQYLWPDFINSTNSIVPIALTGMNISGLLFVYNFLELPRYSPKTAGQCKVTLILLAILAIPGLALPYQSGSLIIYASSLISVLMIGYAVLVAWRMRISAAKFLMINFFFIVLPGSIASFAYEFGWLPEGLLYSHMLELTTAAETLVLSLFLASRIKLLAAETKAAQEKNLELQSSFSQKMVTKLEEDRSHIARELHDSIGQTLSLVHINLRSQAEATEASPSPMMDHQQTLALLKQSITEIRELSHRLHPSQLGRLGLITALDSFVKQCRVEGAPQFKLDISVKEEQIPEQKKIHLYRIAQEAVNNILSHADATLGSISLHQKNSGIIMSIRDNGCGFGKTNNEKTGLGFTSMKDRADIINAEFKVESTPGEGTSVSISFKAV